MFCCGRPPIASRTRPMTIIRITDAGEQVGGQREDLPGLPDAAQVAEAHQQDDADAISASPYGPMAGNAEATAAVPAATCTATVTT